MVLYLHFLSKWKKQQHHKTNRPLTITVNVMRFIKSLVTAILFLIIFSHSLFAEIIYINFIDGKAQTAELINEGEETITIQPLDGGPPEIIPKSEIKTFQLMIKGESDDGALQPEWIIYLRTGEVIEGNITQFTSDFLTIESLVGDGVLQIPTRQIQLITSKKSSMFLEGREGIGYVQNKSTLNSSNGPYYYNADQLSYKFFISNDTFGNFLGAYGDARYNGEKLQIASLEYKMGFIFDQYQNTLLYYAGSFGYLEINDTANNVSGVGISLRAMIGAEIFFNSLPNFGFAGEIGIGMKKIGDYEVTDMSTSNFPSFQIHYYF